MTSQVRDLMTGTLREIGIRVVPFEGVPKVTDYRYNLGTIGRNKATGDFYILRSNAMNAASWQNFASATIDFYENVLSIADASSAPPIEVSGARYILDTATPVHADWDGATAHDIVEFDGATWIATTPSAGGFVYVDDATILYVFTGGSWEPITAAIPDATSTTKGVASFDGIDFLATAGHIIASGSNENVGFYTPSTEVEIAFDNGTRTLTVSVKAPSTSFRYRSNGANYTKTAAESIVIDNAEGLHYIYYNGATLTKTTTWSSDIFKIYAIVAIIYWDATNNIQLYLGDEYLHTTKISPLTHVYLHETRGFALQNGGSLTDIIADGNGDSDTHAQFGVEATRAWDEDAFFDYALRSSTSNIAVYYKAGASADWRVDETAAFSVLTTGTGRAAYNQFTGGSWQQTEVGNNDFVLAHVFTCNDSTRKFGVIQGEAEYGNIGMARAGAEVEINDIVLDGLPLEEFKFLGSIIYQTSDSYGNAVKSRIRTTSDGFDYIDLRDEPISRGGISLAGSSANQIGVVTDNFSGWLSASDTNVQVALETLDASMFGGGLSWSVIVGATAASVGRGYVCNHAVDRVVVTLPAVSVAGNVLRLVGLGAAGWKLEQGVGQQVFMDVLATTAGVTGYMESTAAKDCIELICVEDNLSWVVAASIGNITIS